MNNSGIVVQVKNDRNKIGGLGHTMLQSGGMEHPLWHIWVPIHFY